MPAAARPPLFSDGASWEPIEHEEEGEAEHDGEAHEAAEAAAEEEIEPENTEAITRLEASSAGSAEEGGADAADSATPEAHDAGGGAEAIETSMPSDAVEVGPDPARVAAKEDDADDDDDDAHPGAALQAAKADEIDDDDEGGRGAPVERAAVASASRKSVDGGKSKSGGKTESKSKGKGKLPPQHDGDYERKVGKATGYDAKRDRYNRKSVRSNRVKSKIQIGRPGLRVGQRDKFHLKGDYAYRYAITDGNQAVMADKIWERDLQPDNSNSKHKRRLALNPSAIRTLTINKEEVECIMSWSGGQSAAWIAIRDLRGATVAAIRAASRRAAKFRPMNASKQARDQAVEMKFRAVDDPFAKEDGIDKKRYIVLGQKKKGGNRVGDYLGKAVPRGLRRGTKATASVESRRIEHANNDQPLDATGKREVYNVAMNLPHDRTPPVAIDVAQPGNSFFVPKGKTFRREVSLYRRKIKRSTVRQTWAFGYVGHEVAGRQVADEKRRGWVPLRVLK